MISILIFIILIACYFLYNTSKKTQLEKNIFIDVWLQENSTRTKYLSLLILLIALMLSILIFGTTSGILFWTFTVSTILSLIIVLYPLKIFKKKHFIILFIAILFLEIILNI